jgi:hypothetical protein
VTSLTTGAHGLISATDSRMVSGLNENGPPKLPAAPDTSRVSVRTSRVVRDWTSAISLTRILGMNGVCPTTYGKMS